MKAILLFLFLSVPAFARLTSTAPRTLSEVNQNALPVIAVEPNGNALAVWVDVTNRITASFFIQKTGVWSVPQFIGNGGSPDVGMDGNANGLVVWNNGFSGQIEASFFSGVTRTFSVPIEISRGGFNQLPNISVASSGAAIAVWLNATTGRSFLVQAAEFNGAVWSVPIDVSVAPANFASVSVDRNGNGFVIWQNSNPENIFTSFLNRQ